VSRDASERHYVWISRTVTVGLMMVSAAFMFLLSTAGEAFHLLLSIGAGTGLIYLLRWFWWRINAWSEIAAMVSSFLISIALFVARQRGAEMPAHLSLAAIVAVTTLVWIVVTYITEPVNADTLVRFYRLVRPAGPGWRSIRNAAGLEASPDSLPQALLGWILGCLLIYSALFGTGYLIYGNASAGGLCFTVAAGSAIAMALLLSRMLRGHPEPEVDQRERQEETTEC
jgi:SSS family solute:Na+ symporter